jgi:hypothetical protein
LERKAIIKSYRLSTKVIETRLGFFSSAKTIEFPEKDKLVESINNGEYFWLAGFESDQESGWGPNKNFILSNGWRSGDRGKNYFTNLMPEGAEKAIR